MPFRIPLPVKLLLSYLLVAMAGAIPTLLYLRAELAFTLQNEATRNLLRHAQMLAPMLADRTALEKQVLAQNLASSIDARITLIHESGAVTFDSDVDALTMGSHKDRTEIRAALGTTPSAEGDTDPQEVYGSAHRVSTTTGVDTLYVAVVVPNSQKPGEVLRLAIPRTRVETPIDATIMAMRNAQAVAVSFALVLSLLSAALFVRPLRRIKAAAEALAGGDFARHVGPTANDEVGDVGKAIEQLGAELRRRMAVAGAGEALLAQLIEVLPTPLVVFQVDGEVLAMNGASRMLFQIEDPLAGQHLRSLLEDRAFREALRRAEDESEPSRLSLPQVDRPAFVHVLKRPGTAPLGVLLVPARAATPGSHLPRAKDVHLLDLHAVLHEAREHVVGELHSAGIVLDAPEHVPEVQVTDAAGRLAQALIEVLRGCLPWFGGRAGAITLDLDIEPTRVGVSCDAMSTMDGLQAARNALEPLGGSVEAQGNEVTVWLPRA